MLMSIFPGYIDLSKRRVSPEDIVKCEERYNKGKMVHSIMRHVAEKTEVPIETLYESIAWPLNRKFGHAIDAFKLSITLVVITNPFTRLSKALTGEQKPRSLGGHRVP
jgi:translation initiation factor 2 subunit 1